MRDSISRHFDVLIVVWVLSLALGFSVVAITRTPPADGQWSNTATQVHSGTHWDYPITDGSH
jgi:hypothetical protein